jgi:hypothetical protein
MGTDKVVFVEDPDDLTIAHAQPEVTSPETALTGSHGSDRMRVRGFLLIFFYIRTFVIFYIGILQPFLHLFFVQYLFEAFTIVDIYVLLYHAFC